MAHSEITTEDNLPDIEEELARWHASFPARLVREHLARLKTNRDALAQKIDELEAEYARWESLGVSRSNGPSPEPEKRRGGRGREKRDFILSLLRNRPRMTTSEIRTRLAAVRMISGDQKGRKNLDAILYHMTKDGEIERVQKGVYRVPAARREEGLEPATIGVQT